LPATCIPFRHARCSSPDPVVPPVPLRDVCCVVPTSVSLIKAPPPRHISDKDEGEDTVRARPPLSRPPSRSFPEEGYDRPARSKLRQRASRPRSESCIPGFHKQKMLIACIRERAVRLQVPAEMPVRRMREPSRRARVPYGAAARPRGHDPSSRGYFRTLAKSARPSLHLNGAVASTRSSARRADLPASKSWRPLSRPNCSRQVPARLGRTFGALRWGDWTLSVLPLGVVKRRAREVTGLPVCGRRVPELHPPPPCAARGPAT